MDAKKVPEVIGINGKKIVLRTYKISSNAKEDSLPRGV